MKIAREGRPRQLHRRDWPGFLNRVVPPVVWQRLAGPAGHAGDPRTRWSGKYVVLCWVAMGWSVQTQLTERFREGVELLARLFPRRRRPGRSYQGLVKATGRVGLEGFQRFWRSLRATIPQRLGQRWHWYGWIPLAVDGSRIDAPRTRRNARRLGRAGRNKTHPQWYLTWMVHLPTLLVWDWRQGPGTSSERAHLQDMADSLPASALVVGDVGFGGFGFLGDLTRAGVSFLVRCASNTTLLVEATRQKIERVGEHQYVYLWPTGRRSRTPLRLRLIVLKRRQRRVYLLTNVLESTRLSRPMASELYQARWGAEVGYRSLKQTLGRRKVLAKTPEPGGSELAGSVLALALLMLQGALALGTRITELSVAAALKVIRRAIEALRCRQPSANFVASLRSALKDRYARGSSKRARDWPHKKRESPPRPPKLRRPNRHERTRMNALLWQYDATCG